MDIVAALVGIFVGLVVLAGLVFVLWVLPITLGIRAADRNGYPRLWMLFGIHPIGGWIAYIVLANLTPRVSCPHCGGYITVNYKICPRCHAQVGDLWAARAAGETPQAPGPKM